MLRSGCCWPSHRELLHLFLPAQNDDPCDESAPSALNMKPGRMHQPSEKMGRDRQFESISLRHELRVTLDPVRLLQQIRAAQQQLVDVADTPALGDTAKPTGVDPVWWTVGRLAGLDFLHLRLVGDWG